ncbi:MAG: hypothetical protein GY941_28490 [Planctomycetes bacterium]|nr:hypothetical protein [Planctomycetota bacterium]
MPIRKIGNTWYADIHVDGKRTRKKLSTNKAIAQRMYDELKRKLSCHYWACLAIHTT